jgi:hypothetical protein
MTNTVPRTVHALFAGLKLGVLLALGVVVAVSPPILGQVSSSALITGVVSDETGLALPGVTVTGRSPSLQLPQTSVVTEGDGTYRLRDLPPGIYELTFELPSFQTVKRTELRITAGFTAKVDVTMKVGQIEQSVTVSGQSPVVDVSSAAMRTNLTRDVLDAIPTGKNFAENIAMAPGARYNGAIDVGGNRTANMTSPETNFGSSQQTPLLEGINVSSAGGGAGNLTYTDQRAYQDIELKAVGNDAEVGTPGLAYNAIAKSGGNEFHGQLSAAFERPELQSANIDAAQRALGVTTNASVINQYDLSANIGGRIVRDKLWFFLSERQFSRHFNVPGYSHSPGPDGIYGTADDVPGTNRIDNPTHLIKMSYQPSRTYRVTGFYTESVKHEYERSPLPTTPQLTPFESTIPWVFNPHPRKIEATATPSAKVLFDAQFGFNSYDGPYVSQPGLPIKPLSMDITTGLQTGGVITGLQQLGGPQFAASVGLFPDRFIGGKHEFKIGYQDALTDSIFDFANRENGNYILIFDNGAPFQFKTENRPFKEVGTLRNPAAYIKDTWRLPRFTVNAGLRWEHYHAYTRDLNKTQGQFGNSGFYPGIDVLTWNNIAPRLGVAWDVTGSGRSVVKASWGKFNQYYSATAVAAYMASAYQLTTYKWHDLNGDKLYQPGEVNLDPNGTDFVSLGGCVGAACPPAGNNLVVNPALEQPRTIETSASFEQELSRGLAVRALVVHKVDKGIIAGINTLRPFSAWNIPVSRRDPGPDGITGNADDGGMVQLYDFSSAYRGAQFVNQLNVNLDSDHDSTYNGFELGVTKRSDRNWSLTATYQMVNNHVWRPTAAAPSSPNDIFFPIDDTWDWSGKIYGSYHAPMQIEVSGIFNFLRGLAGQRTYTFRTADPLGGTALSQVGTITVPLEPLGAHRLPPQTVLNLKFARTFKIGPSVRLIPTFQIFNALNDNTPTAISYVAGPTFGTIGTVTPPRIAAFGADFTF